MSSNPTPASILASADHAPARGGQRGFNLIELCACLAVGSIVMSQAVPAMHQLQQRQRLQAVAQTVMTDLQLARAEAVQHAESIELRFSEHPHGSCYVMYSSGPDNNDRDGHDECRCDDSGAAYCDAVELAVLKTQWLPSELQIGLHANVRTLSFHARQGTVTSTGSIDLSLADGTAIRHVVSIAGRVRSCAVGPSIGGLPRC